MLHFRKIGLAAILGMAVGSILSSPKSTAVAKEFYAGKQITILIGYGFGGTYGKYARLFAQHLRKQIPGNPNIIVQSMSGAGGIKANNYAYNVMPRGGNHLFILPDTAVIVQLLRPKKVKYDARKYRSLGSSNQTNTILVVRSDTGVKNINDLKNTEVIFGHTGPGSTAFLIPSTARALLGLKIKLIGGYKGSSKTILAVEQGEVRGAAYNWLAWDSKVPHWFKGDKPFARAILQNGMWRDPALPESVPMLGDLVAEKDKSIVAFMGTLGVIGRGLVLPPGAPKQALGILRPAFDRMIKTKEYVSDVSKRRLRVLYTPAAEVEKAIKDALDNADEKVVARARALIFPKK